GEGAARLGRVDEGAGLDQPGRQFRRLDFSSGNGSVHGRKIRRFVAVGGAGGGAEDQQPGRDEQQRPAGGCRKEARVEHSSSLGSGGQKRPGLLPRDLSFSSSLSAEVPGPSIGTESERETRACQTLSGR